MVDAGDVGGWKREGRAVERFMVGVCSGVVV